MKVYKNGYWILGVGLWLLANFIKNWPDENIRYIQCDVGQGDGIIIKKGFNQIVVDGGKSNDMIDCLEENLPFWDRKLELVIATHDDYDHIGVMDKILLKYEVGLLVDNGIESEKNHWKEVEDLIKSKQMQRLSAYEVGEFRLADISINFLWPKGECPASSNECSVVSRVSYGEFDVLLTGDIDKNIEEEMAFENMESEVLKVTHHGSKEGTSDKFLSEGNFSLAVIGVGKNNYGHPSEEVLVRLKNHNVEVRRTDNDGTIVVASDGEKFWME